MNAATRFYTTVTVMTGLTVGAMFASGVWLYVFLGLLFVLAVLTPNPGK